MKWIGLSVGVSTGCFLIAAWITIWLGARDATKSRRRLQDYSYALALVGVDFKAVRNLWISIALGALAAIPALINRNQIAAQSLATYVWVVQVPFCASVSALYWYRATPGTRRRAALLGAMLLSLLVLLNLSVLALVTRLFIGEKLWGLPISTLATAALLLILSIQFVEIVLHGRILRDSKEGGLLKSEGNEQRFALNPVPRVHFSVFARQLLRKYWIVVCCTGFSSYIGAPGVSGLGSVLRSEVWVALCALIIAATYALIPSVSGRGTPRQIRTELFAKYYARYIRGILFVLAAVILTLLLLTLPKFLQPHFSEFVASQPALVVVLGGTVSTILVYSIQNCFLALFYDTVKHVGLRLFVFFSVFGIALVACGIGIKTFDALRTGAFLSLIATAAFVFYAIRTWKTIQMEGSIIPDKLRPILARLPYQFPESEKKVFFDKNNDDFEELIDLKLLRPVEFPAGPYFQVSESALSAVLFYGEPRQV